MSMEIDGVCEVYRDTLRTAKIQHTCSACKEPIRPGDRYVDHFSIFCDEKEYVKRCMRCETIYQHLLALSGSDDAPDRSLNCGHSYRDIHGSEPPEEIAALAFAPPGYDPEKKAR
jgi:predicted RNA-binding Zn-ribbon protein involved in translation (DUF1610 family)